MRGINVGSSKLLTHLAKLLLETGLWGCTTDRRSISSWPVITCLMSLVGDSYSSTKFHNTQDVLLKETGTGGLFQILASPNRVGSARQVENSPPPPPGVETSVTEVMGYYVIAKSIASFWVKTLWDKVALEPRPLIYQLTQYLELREISNWIFLQVTYKPEVLPYPDWVLRLNLSKIFGINVFGPQPRV